MIYLFDSFTSLHVLCRGGFDEFYVYFSVQLLFPWDSLLYVYHLFDHLSFATDVHICIAIDEIGLYETIFDS